MREHYYLSGSCRLFPFAGKNPAYLVEYARL